ncbi:ArsA family ATPase [bacterium]|nr:ArsA family ATPase [bacterium]
MNFDELLRRRLVFTVGKGGVGRTTVSLAIGLEAARRGKRVLMVELEGARGLERAIDEQRQSRPQASELRRIGHIEVEGKRALEEYLALVIPVRRLLKTVFSSNVYQYFVAAAPGLKELMTVGKIWYEVERDDATAPDLVVVDGPATGHSLQYLRMPKAAAEAFPVGLVHREAERIFSLLQDGDATAVAIVTTPEEMPVNETVEISRGLAELGLPRTLLVVNRVHRAPLTTAEIASLGGARPRDGAPSSPDEALFAEALRVADGETGWAELNRENVERLAREVPIPTVRLPYLFTEEFGGPHVDLLSRELAAQLDGKPPTESP